MTHIVIPSVTPPSALRADAAPHWGPFALLRELGRGSHGAVYLARDPDGEEVALKLLHSRDPFALEGFKNEARYLADLAHPALVAPSELVASNGTLALVMPYVEGRSFTEALAEAAGPPGSGAVLDEPRVRHLVAGLFGALAALHERGLVHLDLKPENVRVTADDRVVLLDFGLARLRAAATRPGEISGSAHWMAPEQLLLDTITPAADVFAAGLLIFTGLAGAHAWDPAGGINARLLTPPRDLAALRPGLALPWVELVRALLAATASERPDPATLARSFATAHDLGAPTHALPPFTGRTAELAQLEGLLAGVRSGVPALVRVFGPPGVGKTALVERFAGSAARAGAAVVHGRCFAAESIPFKALDAALDQLAELARVDHDASAILARSPDLPSLARVFPIFRTFLAADAAASTDHASEDDLPRARTLLRALARQLSRTRPLVVVIEDAHWGDADAVDVLMALVEPPDAPRALVVLTHRDGEAWSDAPFSGAFERRLHKGVPFSLATLPVDPLSPSDAQALAVRALGRDDATIAPLVAAAAGNALVLTRLLAAPDTAGRDVSSLVSGAFARFAEPVRRFVLHVALAGRPLPIALAARAATVPTPSRALVGELVAQGLIRLASASGAAGRVVMPAHDLVRHALASQLDPEAARAVHRALAEALAASPEQHHDLGLVAHHFAKAGVRAEATRWALRGAEHAERASAFGRAAELFALVLEDEGLTRDERRPIQRRQAQALREAGRGHAAAHIYQDLAASSSDAAERRTHLRSAADALMTLGAIDEGLAVLEPVFAELGMKRSSAPALRGLRLVGGALAILLRLRRGVASRRSDPVSAERFDTTWPVAKSLVFVDPLSGLDQMLRALAFGEASGDPRRVARVTGPLAGFVLGTIGPLRPVANRWIAAHEQLADERYFAGTSALWRGIMLGTQGHLLQATPHAHRAIDALAGVNEAHWERFQGLSLLALLLHYRGHFTTVASLTRTHLADAERRGDLYAQVLLSSYLILTTLAAGRTDETRAIADWTIRTWLPGRYSPQTFYALRARRMDELLTGRAEVAARELAAGRAAFKRAGGYRIVFSRFDHDLLEARIALATGDRGPLWSIDKLLMRLDKLAIPEGPAHASLLRASVAMTRDDRTTALAALDLASQRLATIGVDLEAQVARLRSAQIRGDATSADAARLSLRELGVADPDQWAQVIAPGYERLIAAR